MPSPRDSVEICLGADLLPRVRAHCKKRKIKVSAFLRGLAAREVGKPELAERKIGRPKAE
jgi:hypothetical protein